MIGVRLFVDTVELKNKETAKILSKSEYLVVLSGAEVSLFGKVGEILPEMEREILRRPARKTHYKI